jgi:uncharacterized protein (DUF1501 family)
MTTNGSSKNGGNGSGKAPVFVVLQLSGGNDVLNTVVPHSEGLYYDFRSTTGIAQDAVIRLDDKLGLHPTMGPIKNMWDQGNVAIINGIGYPQPDRSHFRSMDIWHTAEPEKFVSDGWLGKVIREIDQQKLNVCTGVSFGTGLPRAMYLSGTPAMSVSQLEGYGLLTTLAGEKQRRALNAFTRMYTPEEFDEQNMLLEHLGQTGIDTLTSVDMLKSAPENYTSTVEYAPDPLSQNLKGIAQVHLSGIGTRIFYAQIGGFDVHGNESNLQSMLWDNVSRSVNDFFTDLREHDAAEEVVMLLFSEFGRRVKDNGNGTDHGSGGSAFMIGDRVNGGFYGDYPSLEPSKQLNGDLQFNNDFRSLYSSILDQWMGIDPTVIINGQFDQFENIVTPMARQSVNVT